MVHLHKGTIGKGVHSTPVGGDPAKLPFANDLSPLERKLARAQSFLARHMPGTQEVRQLMGHSQLGARVVYGDVLFFTISPNEQHSALVLRLSRFRRNDPYVQHSQKELQTLAGRQYPTLEAQRSKRSKAEPSLTTTSLRLHGGPTDDDEVVIDLPEYDLRRLATARDPVAVMEAYHIQILLRLSTVLGIRMCPNCPRCNAGVMGCSDRFGSNMRPFGGGLGGMEALGGATEHQGHGTPHFHGQGHIVCAHQFKTLHEIAELMTDSKATLSAEQVKDFQAWMHREEPMDEALWEDFLPKVETEWTARYQASEHKGLCVTPAFLGEPPPAASLHVTSAETPSQQEALASDAQQIMRAYTGDVQFVFSRVQHHVHKRGKNGKHEPLKACLAKGTKGKGKCKHGFPLIRLKKIKAPQIVCKGCLLYTSPSPRD